MINFTQKYCHILTIIVLTSLVAACGSKSNTTTSSTSPSVFYSHSVALRNNTTLAWGANTYGQLGNGDSTGVNQYVPVPVTMTNVTGVMIGVSAGETHTLGFTDAGNVYAWGNNGFGQLGDNSNTIRWAPIQVYSDPTTTPVTYLTGVLAVSAGGSHSLAIGSGNIVWAWGDNTYGQLGDTSLATASRLFAGQVKDSANAPFAQVYGISAGARHSLAIVGKDANGRANGTAFTWGYNASGQLGRQPDATFGNLSTSTNSNVPVQVVIRDASTNPASYTALQNVTAIAAGGVHSLFLLADGTVWACGYNALGQLGVGDTIDRRHGVVHVLTDVNNAAFTGIGAVAAGLDHSLALRPSDGSVWAWGFNKFGQLGNGVQNAAFTPTAKPVQVHTNETGNPPLLGIVKIVAIGHHSLAVDISGKLWAWGENTRGQLGIAANDSTNQYYATPVSGFVPVTGRYDLYIPLL